jgi:hypothetical protein
MWVKKKQVPASQDEQMESYNVYHEASNIVLQVRNLLRVDFRSLH